MSFWRNCAYFAGAFVGTAAGLYAIVPRDPAFIDRALAERATCEVLVVGPSYIEGFKPDTFDDESKRVGLGLRSCKLSAPGLQGPELRYVLGRTLRHPWPKLRYVVIDITLGDGMNFPRVNWFQERVIAWHVVGMLPWLLDHYRRSGYDRLRGNAGELWAHVKHYALNYFGLGRGAALLQGIRLVDRLARTSEQVAEAARVVTRPSRPDAREGYELRLAHLIEQKAGVKPGSNSYALQLREEVRGLGHDALFLISPVLSTQRPPRPGDPKDPVQVLDFEDPARFPELYTREVRGHTSHLTGEGGRLYSRALARVLLELDKRGPSERPRQ